MESEVLDKLLELDKDELVLWSGNPEPFIALDEYYKPAFIRNYIIAIVIVFVVFALALAYNASNGEVNLVALGVVCAIPLIIIPAGLSQYSNYGQNCKYYITNKNIVFHWESRMLKVPLNDINELDHVNQSDGTVSIRMGKAVGIPIRKNRDYALKCIFANTEGEKFKGCLLYNLSEKDAGIVLELLDKYRVIA